MSTATYDRPPLYAVPTPEEQQAKFGLLLATRRHARQALDTLLALPGGAAGWVVRQVRTLLAGVGQDHLLDKAVALLRNGISFVRSVGVIPLVASVLSTPAVWRTTVRWARAAGTALAGFGRGLWARTKDLLTRSGTTGARIAQVLSRAGTTVGAAAHAVASHPVIQQLMQTVRSLAGLVRPLSQTVVVHRLLGLLVPSLWLRVVLEALAMPLVIALGMPGVVRPAGSSRPAPVAPQGVPAAHPADGAAAAATVPDVNAPWSKEEDTAEPLNRAERRAQQQEQARARRSHTQR